MWSITRKVRWVAVPLGLLATFPIHTGIQLPPLGSSDSPFKLHQFFKFSRSRDEVVRRWRFHIHCQYSAKVIIQRVHETV